MSLFKRIERYVSAFFKLGRIARQSKQASIAVGAIEPRLDALQAELGAVPGRVESVAARVDAVSGQVSRVAEDVAGLSRRLDGVERTLFGGPRGEIPPTGQTGAAGDQGLAGDVATLSEGLSAAVDRLAAQLGALDHNGRDITSRLAEAEARSRATAAEQRLTARAYTDLTRRIDLVRFGQGARQADTPPGPAPERPEGLEALIAAFYNRLEDRFRGSREAIKGRLAVYLPDVRAAVARSGKPVIDLGCGRGEWLELLAEQGIAAEGVDTNPVQIDEASSDLAIREGDALAALSAAPDGTFAAVTAHHLIEHLPFDRLVWMTREALRCLAPGGVLIYETPNPRNLIVGATTFNIDPTHLAPRPEELLVTLLDTIGFHPVEARGLHPYDDFEDIVARGDIHPDLVKLLFGPQDLAVLGTRPDGGR